MSLNRPQYSKNLSFWSQKKTPWEIHCLSLRALQGLSQLPTLFSHGIYRYTKGVKGAAKEIEELAAGIRTLSEILHGLQLVLSQYDDDRWDPNLRLHHLNSCRETLLKVQKKIDSNDSQTSNKSAFEATIQKLKWPFSASEVKALLSEVERHKATINVAMTGDSLAAILRGLSRQDKYPRLGADPCPISLLISDSAIRQQQNTHSRVSRNPGFHAV